MYYGYDYDTTEGRTFVLHDRDGMYVLYFDIIIAITSLYFIHFEIYVLFCLYSNTSCYLSTHSEYKATCVVVFMFCHTHTYICVSIRCPHCL